MFNTFDDRTTADLLDLVRYKRRNGTWSNTKNHPFYTPQVKPVHFHNESGEEIPAYACMKVIGTTNQHSRDYAWVDKPDGDDEDTAAYLFNGPNAIADGEEGTAQAGPIYLALDNGATLTADLSVGPATDQWYVEEDGKQYISHGPGINTPDDITRVSLSHKRPWFDYTDFTVIDSSGNGYFDATNGYLDGSAPPNASNSADRDFEWVTNQATHPTTALGINFKTKGRYLVNGMITPTITKTASQTVWYAGRFLSAVVPGGSRGPFKGVVWAGAGAGASTHVSLGVVNITSPPTVHMLRCHCTANILTSFTALGSSISQSDITGDGWIFCARLQQ